MLQLFSQKNFLLSFIFAIKCCNKIKCSCTVLCIANSIATLIHVCIILLLVIHVAWSKRVCWVWSDHRTWCKNQRVYCTRWCRTKGLFSLPVCSTWRLDNSLLPVTVHSDKADTCRGLKISHFP